MACEPPPAPIDIHSFAGRCHKLKDDVSGRFVARDALGFSANASQAGATPFHLQATALGRYLLYGTGGQMPQVGPLDTVTATTTPGAAADWRMTTRNGKLSFANVSNGRGLTVRSGGRLAQSSVVETRWSLVAASGCDAFPEVQVNATGTPLKGTSPTAPVRGFLDSHTHVSAFRFLGGKFHCGRPWSPYGVAVALDDCADHKPNGAEAVVENFLRTGTPVGTHDIHGWPTFAGWPRPESLTHEGTYWKWIERAWRGGLRIMVNDLVENRALCEIYPLKENDCNEMNSVRLQARDMYALQDYIDAQFRGPGKGFFRIVRTPVDARRVINEGKLAVVLGVEVSEVLDCGRRGSTPLCDEEQIDTQLDELQALGVTSLFPVHKFDNALGGTAFDSGGTGLLVNTGNKYATGEFWDARACPPGAAEADNSPTSLSGNSALVASVLGAAAEPLLQEPLPAYPPGPLCNPKGLTALGRYVVNALADRGMIIETDHFSVKARREALAILEGRSYSGLITSHSWGDATARRRLQNLGGVVAPYANESPTYAEEWAEARATRPVGPLFGVGYGSDTNGLGAQAGPRPGASADRPVIYPYRTFDGGTVMDRSRSGTKVWDVNTDGAANYGLFPDWVEDLRRIAGPQIVTDMANGAEAYLQMWARARA
ncbi:MAG: Coagulation factor 5/8 type domain-containing protein [Actinomycetota bacterium]|nr:Coagulation factor 5/8 type domain-containing protein [Actinomycetota bacterium]